MDTVVVVMRKDLKTGFLDKELASLTITENENLIVNLFVQENKNDKLNLHIRLSTERDLNDWEYQAVFDYYDTDVFNDSADSIIERDDYYNPTWEIIFDYTDNTEELEKKITKILQIHKDELSEVYDIIKDKESEYIDNK